MLSALAVCICTFVKPSPTHVDDDNSLAWRLVWYTWCILRPLLVLKLKSVPQMADLQNTSGLHTPLLSACQSASPSVPHSVLTGHILAKLYCCSTQLHLLVTLCAQTASTSDHHDSLRIQFGISDKRNGTGHQHKKTKKKGTGHKVHGLKVTSTICPFSFSCSC